MTMTLNASSSHIVQLSSEYVREFVRQHLPVWAVYHSLRHTRETVDACIEIGTGSGLGGDELERLVLAAWFHDAGYSIRVDGHEEVSCEIAENFLTMHGYPRDGIDVILPCIMATKIAGTPASRLERIIKDADLISLGRTEYFEHNDLLRSEIETRDTMKYSDVEWLTRSIDFLSAHRYHTEYAREKYSRQVAENIETLRAQLAHTTGPDHGRQH